MSSTVGDLASPFTMKILHRLLLVPVLLVMILVFAYFISSYEPTHPDVLSRSGVFSTPDMLPGYLDSANLSSSDWPALVYFLYPVDCPDTFNPQGSSTYFVLADANLSVGLGMCVSESRLVSRSEFFLVDMPLELRGELSYPVSFEPALGSLPLKESDYLESFSYTLVPSALFDLEAKKHSRTPVWFFTVKNVRSRETTHYILRSSDNFMLFNGTLASDMVPVYR